MGSMHLIHTSNLCTRLHTHYPQVKVLIQIGGMFGPCNVTGVMEYLGGETRLVRLPPVLFSSAKGGDSFWLKSAFKW